MAFKKTFLVSKNYMPDSVFDIRRGFLSSDGSMSIDVVRWRDMTATLKHPIVLDVHKDRHGYQISNRDIWIFGFGDTFDEAMYDFSSSFMADVKCGMAYGRGSNARIDHLMDSVAVVS